MGNRPLRMKIRRGCPLLVSPESDPELTAVLSRVATSIGLEACTPPSPKPSQRDEWFLGTGRGSQPHPAPVPFFPEVHEELMSLWTAPFSAGSCSSASSILTTLDCGSARGYVDIPHVESAVAVHLCLQNAATWRNRPRLPSKACKLMTALAAKACIAAGQAASALHAMAILRAHQAEALKCMRVVPTRGWCRSCARRLTSPYGWRKSQHGPSGRRCPHLWAKSAIYGSALLRWAMSTKCAFSMLSSPRLDCSATLSRTVPSSSQQYRSRLRPSNTSCPGVMHNLPPLRRGPAPSLLVAMGALLHPPELLRPMLNHHLGQRQASCWSAAPPVSQPAPKSSREATKWPWQGNPEMEAALSQETARTVLLLPPEEGRVENHLFCSAAGSRASGNHIFKERAISFSSGFSGLRADSVRHTASSLSPMTPPLASGQETAVGRHNASPRISGQSLRGRGEFCCGQSERDAFCAIQLDSPPLHHHGYVDCPFGATCTEFGGVACAAHPVPLAQSYNPTRLCDSVHQVTSQVQWRSWDFGGSPRRTCLQTHLSQPRRSRGFTVLTSSYPRKVVASGQSWICESWIEPCTSFRSRCWRRSTPSDASNPRICLQRSIWRRLTFMSRFTLDRPSVLGPQPVGDSGQLGKEQALPVQKNSFLSMELDSVSVVARLTNERAQSMLTCLSSFRGRMVVPLKHFQRLLGYMESTAAVSPLGLLHMGPLQHRLHSRVGHVATVQFAWPSRQCVATHSAPGRTLSFYGSKYP